MRIIAGAFKGRILRGSKGAPIRPTSGMVKEALFSMIAAELPGAAVADLFAGTGNLGLEALSRGARKCYFCDASQASLGLLKKNISICGAEAFSVIIPGAYEKALDRISEQLDVIFLDPPYQKGFLARCIGEISKKSLLGKGGIIAAEHGKEERLPETIGHYVKIKEKTYGDIRLSLYQSAAIG